MLTEAKDALDKWLRDKGGAQELDGIVQKAVNVIDGNTQEVLNIVTFNDQYDISQFLMFDGLNTLTVDRVLDPVGPQSLRNAVSLRNLAAAFFYRIPVPFSNYNMSTNFAEDTTNRRTCSTSAIMAANFSDVSVELDFELVILTYKLYSLPLTKLFESVREGVGGKGERSSGRHWNTIGRRNNNT